MAELPPATAVPAVDEQRRVERGAREFGVVPHLAVVAAERRLHDVQHHPQSRLEPLRLQSVRGLGVEVEAAKGLPPPDGSP